MKVSTNGIIGNRYVVFAGLTLALLMSASCSKGNVQAAPAMPAPLVTVVKATAHDVPKYLDEIGRNAAFESVTVTPQVGGRIIERHFQDGENLKQRTAAVRHRSASIQGAGRCRAGALAQAKAALDLAKIQFAAGSGSHRNARHLEAGLRHQEEHGRRGPGAGGVGAGGARNREAEPRVLLHPFADRRSRRRTPRRRGQRRAANSTSLLSIQRLDPIYADFTVTESDLPEVQRQMAHGALEGSVRLPFGSGRHDAGRARRVSRQLGAERQRHGEPAGDVPQCRPSLLAGPVRECEAGAGDREGAVLIPNEATQISQKGPFVYVVKPDDTAELRPVTLGQRQGDQVVVTDGVARRRTRRR